MAIISPLNPSLTGTRQNFDSRFQDEIKLASLFRSAANVNELLMSLKQELRDYFEAEAFTIYFADKKNNQIVSKVKAGRLRKEIRLPIDNTSIAGFVAATGIVVNIADAYDQEELQKIHPDLELNRTWDDQTKFTTRQVLAAPVYCKNTLFGVIQLINKKNGKKFTPEDADNIKLIAEAIGKFILDHMPDGPQKQSSQTGKIMPGNQPLAPYTILVKNSILSQKELQKAINKAEREKSDLESILLENFNLSRKQLGKSLAEYYGLSFEDLTTTIYNPINYIASAMVALALLTLSFKLSRVKLFKIREKRVRPGF